MFLVRSGVGRKVTGFHLDRLRFGASLPLRYTEAHFRRTFSIGLRSGPRQRCLALARCLKAYCFKETSFVSIVRCIVDFAHRRLLFAFSSMALAGICSGAAAQTVPPQLLPYTVKLIAGGGTVAIAAGATC